MDGTLTCPFLDFDAIRAEMGISGPILEAMRRMTPDKRRAAQEILDRHESRAAADSTLNDGCDRLLAFLRQHRIRSALITRNSRSSVDIVLDRHGIHEQFDLLISRELTPTKPHPFPLLHACESLEVDPRDAWMVGDGSHDIEAGNAAGIRTVWISHRQPRDFDAVPTHEVATLGELMALLAATIDCAA
jgi:HAD superfamily hydrolase (TIGR01509 family)